jgi:hypothetical protein
MCPLLASMLAQFHCHMQTAKVKNLKAHYTKAHGNGVTGSYKHNMKSVQAIQIVVPVRHEETHMLVESGTLFHYLKMKKRICIWPNELNNYKLLCDKGDDDSISCSAHERVTAFLFQYANNMSWQFPSYRGLTNAGALSQRTTRTDSMS